MVDAFTGSYDDQDGFVQPYLGSESDGLRRDKACSVRSFGVQGLLLGAGADGVYRLDSAMRCWLIRDGDPHPRWGRPMSLIKTFRLLSGTLRWSRIVWKTLAGGGNLL